MDRALSGATYLGQSGLGSNGNEEVLHIPWNTIRLFSAITRIFIAEVQSLNSTDSANWAMKPLHPISRNIIQYNFLKLKKKRKIYIYISKFSSLIMTMFITILASQKGKMFFHYKTKICIIQTLSLVLFSFCF